MHPPPEYPERYAQINAEIAATICRIREQLTRLRNEIDRGRQSSLPPRAD